MSENQPSFTPPEEEATHSTTPEAPIAPKSRSRPKRSLSTKNNQQEPVTSSEVEIAHSTTPERPATAKSRSRPKRSPSSKKPPPQRKRQLKQKRTRETDKPAIAGPQAQEVNAPETTTEPGKKATVTRKRVSSSRKKLKERQEGQAPASEARGHETFCQCARNGGFAP